MTVTVSRFYPGGESVIGKIEANLVAKWLFRIYLDASRETRVSTLRQ